MVSTGRVTVLAAQFVSVPSFNLKVTTKEPEGGGEVHWANTDILSLNSVDAVKDVPEPSRAVFQPVKV
jgi:hypothetical protein